MGAQKEVTKESPEEKPLKGPGRPSREDPAKVGGEAGPEEGATDVRDTSDGLACGWKPAMHSTQRQGLIQPLEPWLSAGGELGVGIGGAGRLR